MTAASSCVLALLNKIRSLDFGNIVPEVEAHLQPCVQDEISEDSGGPQVKMLFNIAPRHTQRDLSPKVLLVMSQNLLVFSGVAVR